MSETFTFTGSVRQILQDEFVITAAGKILAKGGTVLIQSEGGALVAFLSREGFEATFGRDPLTPEEVAPEPEPKPKPKRKAPAKPKGK